MDYMEETMMDEATLLRLHAIRRRRPNDIAFYWAMTVAVSLVIGASDTVVSQDIARLEATLDREE
jgi:hypothetical protein